MRALGRAHVVPGRGDVLVDLDAPQGRDTDPVGAGLLDRLQHAVSGFDVDVREDVPTTPEPEPDRLALLRSTIGAEVADVYPGFAARVLGAAASRPASRRAG